MREFGDLSGIIFNRQTGNLIGGNQRKKNFDPEWPIEKEEFKDELGTVARGYIKTPFGDWTYREVNWPEEKEKAANLAANKHGGQFEMMDLKDILFDLEKSSFDLELTGFDSIELKKLNGAGESDGSPQLGNLKYQIVVECEDEAQQSALMKKFEKEGIECRPLIL